jgi:transposase
VTIESLLAENRTQKQEIAFLNFRLSQLEKMLFGPKSERFVKQEMASNQIPLFEQEPLPDVEEKEKQTVTYERNKGTKKNPNRIPLPEDLPRIDIIIEPKEDVSGFIKIGEDITEVLDIIPPQFRVLRLIRPRYANPLAKTGEVDNPILIAPMPPRVIDRGIPSTRLLVYIIMSKFMDHLPYYRQIKIFQRIGVNIKANTINGWIAKTCVLLKVLYDKFCQHHFSKSYLQADETRIQVLKVKKTGKKGKSHTGYYWVYYDPIDKHVVFIFDPGRGRKYAASHLQNFSGKLQTDGLSVYDAFDKLEDTTLLGCMAHVRRKFIEALTNDKKRAEQVIEPIQQLYAIERQAREENYTPAQRLELRQEKAAPIMAGLKTKLDDLYHSPEVLPKSAIGQAVRYALGRWKYLERYLDDGQVEIDNNLVENAIRPVALGRKNYLFAGSEEGARWGAIIYTLIGSAVRHGHDPLEYLSDVLRRLPESKTSSLHELFPANWAKAPESEFDLL